MWTVEDEQQAYGEYLQMVEALQSTDEFHNEWSGAWEDHTKEVFGGRKVKVKGDKNKYMKYWIENQKVINDTDWDKINNEEDYYGNF